MQRPRGTGTSLVTTVSSLNRKEAATLAALILVSSVRGALLPTPQERLQRRLRMKGAALRGLTFVGNL